MRLGRLTWLVVVGALLALPMTASAQDGTLSGTVLDNTGGVLPGSTVTAENEATGNVFETVTDETGAFRVPVRIGIYTITVEFPGMQGQAQSGVRVLVGQEVAMGSIELAVSTIQETITVTGEAPLLDVTSSDISGNIDSRQIEDLPLNGRNWLDLSLLAPGSRDNASTSVPQGRQGYFQVNVDGQQVTFTVCCRSNQPRYSRDAIAEFELSTNRFDATKGRTAGMMVNAITKSGTNSFAGTFAGYFRDDSLNAKDFIQDRVIPYENQQYSGTIGGPIVQDRVHFFVNWEYEREPRTVTFNSVFPEFNTDLFGTRIENKGGGKGDVQFTPQARMSARYSRYRTAIPHSGGGASNHPSTSSKVTRNSDQVLADYTQVIGNTAVNQIKGGSAFLYFTLEPHAGYSGQPNRRTPGGPIILEGVTSGREIGGGTPRITFSGYTIGSAGNTPQRTGEKIYSLRDDFTSSYTMGGRHDVKLGGEYIRYTMGQCWCNNCDGSYRSRQRAPANLPELMPSIFDASTWNLDAMSPLFTEHQIAVGNFCWDRNRDLFATWYQDDWTVSDRLTLNLGIRYDLDLGGLGEEIEFQPWLSGNRAHDLNNIAPRTGFAYRAGDSTVIRGGYGLFFTQLENDAQHQSFLQTQHVSIFLPNDGRADFATNPFNGPRPSGAEAFANRCHLNNSAAGCVEQSVRNEIPFGDHRVSYSHMVSAGFQQQIGQDASFEANYVFTGGRSEEERQQANLTYNPATGANFPFRDLSRRPFAGWGLVSAEIMEGRSNYQGLETSFTKRFSSSWQANATYTMASFRDDDWVPQTVVLTPGAPKPTSFVPLGFDVPIDIGGEYGLATSDQRHRATFNGIWEGPGGVQVSGLYFFGSGQRFRTRFGGDNRQMGRFSSQRLRRDGTIVPRNDLVGDPLHRVDIRLMKRQSIGGTATIDGIFEVFNLLNHENFGSYTDQERNRNFGKPSFNSNVAYQPRIIQLGFRLAF